MRGRGAAAEPSFRLDDRRDHLRHAVHTFSRLATAAIPWASPAGGRATDSSTARPTTRGNLRPVSTGRSSETRAPTAPRSTRCTRFQPFADREDPDAGADPSVERPATVYGTTVGGRGASDFGDDLQAPGATAPTFAVLARASPTSDGARPYARSARGHRRNPLWHDVQNGGGERPRDDLQARHRPGTTLTTLHAFTGTGDEARIP